MQFFLLPTASSFLITSLSGVGKGGMRMAGGDAQGGEGECTCILCIPPGYAPECRYEVQIGISVPFPKIIISFFKFYSSEDGEETAWASSSTSGLSVSCNQPTTEGSRSNHSDSDGSSGNTASLQVGQPFHPLPAAEAE